MAGTWQIYVDGLEFYAFHGVPQAEREVGHRYRMRIEAEFDGPQNPVADDVRQSIDYADLADIAVVFCTSKQFKTVEALAWGLAGHIFQKFELADVLTLTIEKALPPMPVIAEAAGVSLSISRDEWHASAASPSRERNPQGGKRR